MPIILFIDEAHTMIGAGGQAGQSDAANLLKPALARGELRTIAATTWAEYKKYFEKDAALARRFQVVKVEEPDEERAVRMMRGLTAMLEKHHDVRILDEAVDERRQAVASVHPRPATSGQVGQPARHRLRTGGDQPERHPAGRRGLPPPDRSPPDRDRHPRPRKCHRRRSTASGWPSVQKALEETQAGSPRWKRDGRTSGSASRRSAVWPGRSRPVTSKRRASPLPTRRRRRRQDSSNPQPSLSHCRPSLRPRWMRSAPFKASRR